jgi:multidrug efflux pump subunit AcrA (membrane-fusion protein)
LDGRGQRICGLNRNGDGDRQSIVVPEGGLVKAGTVIVELSDDEERATVTEAQKIF